MTSFTGCVEVFSSISPSTNVFIPYASTDDVVFTCTVAGADGYSVLWQLSGLQIHTTNMNRYIIQPSDDNRVSNLTVTQEGRRYIDLEVISVECHADKDDAFGLILGKQIFYIVQFGKAIHPWECIYVMTSSCRSTWRGRESEVELQLRTEVNPAVE